MNVGIGTGAVQFNFWDICLEFSIYCLCSVTSVVAFQPMQLREKSGIYLSYGVPAHAVTIKESQEYT
jgi:hypothetical protein